MARWLVLPLAAVLLLGTAADDRDYAAAREHMVTTIERITESVTPAGQRRLDPAVLDVMRRVPRHRLVPDDIRDDAYDDRPLPIGHDQTISQPFIVALMTDLLRPKRQDVVLEVGTGSGYQAAVLSQLVAHVYTIEIVEPLARKAASDLAALGYRNISVRAGDGYAGWPEHAPFDGIIVTAGANHIPQPLIEQLKPGARMVIPVGPNSASQVLTLVEKQSDGDVRIRRILPVAFVPLTGDRARRD